jgi:two-component system cell cycle response regulator DivK
MGRYDGRSAMNNHAQPLVLVVDDEPRNTKLACDVLGAAGFRTIAADTGAAAVALAREQLPDVVLMDVRLPDFDGAEAARQLKEDDRTAAIPVVALTALTAAPAGFDGHLEKPFDIVEFPELVRGYCRTTTHQ